VSAESHAWFCQRWAIFGAAVEKAHESGIVSTEVSLKVIWLNTGAGAALF